MSEGELILYSAEDGAATIGLRAIGGTVWLTQLEMAELFDTSKQNISLHISNILAEGGLTARSVVKESLTTAADGKASRVRRLRMGVAHKLVAERFGVFDTKRRAAEAVAADEADIAQLEVLERVAKGRKNGGSNA